MSVANLKAFQESNQIDLSLCRAVLYRALALGFRSPTEETLTRLLSPTGAEALSDAAATLDRCEGSNLAEATRALTGSRLLPMVNVLNSYRSLFGHTVRGPVPPYETEYGAEAYFQQPHELADLTGFYRAFGLTLRPEEHERADHVSCEYEFLCFLSLKEAYARENQDTAMLEETFKATRLFLRDHLGRFAPTFAKKITRVDGGGFYRALAELTLRFAALECARLGVPLRPESLKLRPATDDSVPMACGGEAECPLMGDIRKPQDTDL